MVDTQPSRDVVPALMPFGRNSLLCSASRICLMALEIIIYLKLKLDKIYICFAEKLPNIAKKNISFLP